MDALFRKKLKQLDKLIHSFAWKFRKGADADDLYQEGCITLLHLSRKFPDLPEVEFTKLAKRSIKNRMIDYMRRNYSHNKVLLDSQIVAEEDSPSFIEQVPTEDVGPEKNTQHSESKQTVSNFLADLLDRLDENSAMVLNEIVYPDDLSKEEYILLGRRYMNIPGVEKQVKTPTWAIEAKLVGWGDRRVRKCILKIRQRAARLAPFYDYGNLNKFIRA